MLLHTRGCVAPYSVAPAGAGKINVTSNGGCVMECGSEPCLAAGWKSPCKEINLLPGFTPAGAGRGDFSVVIPVV